MNKQEIYHLISNASGIDPEELTPDLDLYEDLNCDQTDIIELKLHLEDLLKTKIDEDKFLNVNSIQDLFSLIEEYTDDIIE